MTDNELIAEFIEFTPENKGWRTPEGFLQCAFSVVRQELMFDKSWDWLMPVVEKIESLHDDHHGYFQVFIHGNTCSIQGTNLHKAIEDLAGYGWVYTSDPNAILKTKIESTYYNVVEFIKWHNAPKV